MNDQYNIYSWERHSLCPHKSSQAFIDFFCRPFVTIFRLQSFRVQPLQLCTTGLSDPLPHNWLPFDTPTIYHTAKIKSVIIYLPLAVLNRYALRQLSILFLKILTTFSAHCTNACISFLQGTSSKALIFQQDITAVISERHGAAENKTKSLNIF